MEKIRQNLIDSVDSSKLRRIDRLVNLVFIAFLLIFLGISIVGTWLNPGLLPGLWSELGVTIAFFVAYNLAIRRRAIDLRLGVVYTGIGVLTSLPLLIIGVTISLFIYSFIEPIGEFDFWSFLVFAAIFFGSISLAERAGAKGAKRFWRSITESIIIDDDDSIHRSAFYLVEKKWTDSWFYGLTFLVVEILPILLRSSPISYWYIGLVIGANIMWLIRAWYILHREQDRLASLYDESILKNNPEGG